MAKRPFSAEIRDHVLPLIQDTAIVNDLVRSLYRLFKVRPYHCLLRFFLAGGIAPIIAFLVRWEHDEIRFASLEEIS